jgi:hypothetical protein
MGTLLLAVLAAFSNPATAQSDLLPDVLFDEEAMNDWDISGFIRPGSVLLRFNGSIPNIGLGEFRMESTGEDLGDGTEKVVQRVFRDDGSSYVRDAGEFAWDGVRHMQSPGWTSYRLSKVLENGGVGETVAEGQKISVCIQSTTTYDDSLPNYVESRPQRGCTAIMGISVGWTDIYPKALDFQWIDITGVPRGTYWLEAEVDPANEVLESDETNNTARILVDLQSGLLPPPDPDPVPDGDVNGDNAVDAVDVQLVINGVLGLDIGTVNADINGDGQVDAVDVQLVINIVLGVG